MKPTYKDYLEGTRRILELSTLEKVPYRTVVSGREFIVYPNVFSPKYFHDTEIFAQHLPVRHGEELLEIGPGTGAISITAVYEGAVKVVAIDINSDAVRNTQANIELHQVQKRVEVRHGNVYDALKQGETFDTIFWNMPFGFVETNNASDLDRAVFDSQYRSTERFIKESKRHLKHNGRVLIGFSSTLGRLDLLEQFCKAAKLELRLLYKEQSEETYPVTFEMFEAKPK